MNEQDLSLDRRTLIKATAAAGLAPAAFAQAPAAARGWEWRSGPVPFPREWIRL